MNGGIVLTIYLIRSNTRTCVACEYVRFPDNRASREIKVQTSWLEGYWLRRRKKKY